MSSSQKTGGAKAVVDSAEAENCYYFQCRLLHENEDYYKVLEVDYDATDEVIRLNYRRLALKWHPDKHKGDRVVTSKFQEINEAYRVLSDPTKRLDYDISGNYEINKYTLREYLTRFKGMILTCNGLGMNHSTKWTQQLMESEPIDQQKGLFFL